MLCIEETTRAKMVAGKAPERMTCTSANCSPATMGTPNPPAPIKAARVAVPMVKMADVRMPAMIVGAASGSRTDRRICHSVMPSARPVSTTLGAASRKPE